MISFDDFFLETGTLPLNRYHEKFRDLIETEFYNNLHGEFETWMDSLDRLPDIRPIITDFTVDEVTVGFTEQLDSGRYNQILRHLKLLHPWRKGPWNIFGIKIDAEWRSNLKWDRMKDHISPLTDRLVLDIGSGNGYYAFRMLENQPGYVLCVDPGQLFMMQFRTFKKYLPEIPIEYLPLKDEQLPDDMEMFDTVFSMGVLYHRRDPLKHLKLLNSYLKPGGEMVLETLVVEGDKELHPAGRYAQMRNVFSIPSCRSLQEWLEDSGFMQVRLIDKTRTTISEQRSTEWMRFQSLGDFLSPGDDSLTIEGHPSPVRAIYICQKA